MIVLITGASHTGKTLLTQRLLEKHQFPYLSIDHLKMGLIRSGSTSRALTDYLWPIAREIIKTVLENHQNLIMEGCYIPWAKDFDAQSRKEIRFFCLVMSERYIQNHFDNILDFASVCESRKVDGTTKMTRARKTPKCLSSARRTTPAAF